jgi:acylphosphatase
MVQLTDSIGAPKQDGQNGPVRPEDQVRLVAMVYGDVQGVGFRWWTMRRATELGLTGHAKNLPDGRVEVVAEGDRAACRRLLELMRLGATPGYVQQVTEHWEKASGGLSRFIAR